MLNEIVGTTINVGIPVLLNSKQLEVDAAAADTPLKRLAVLKQYWKDSFERMRTAFERGDDVRNLVFARARAVDQFISIIWDDIFDETPNDLVLAAVGGYGRGELMPHSDIDVLILLRGSDEPYREQLEQFITSLWDVGMAVGSSVRNLEDCVIEAKADVTVTTNMSEARLLAGSFELLEEMQTAIAPDRVWPSKQYFKAKLDEQDERHRRYHDQSYKLEPNIKESPGGLRDIQTIGWIAKRHFGADSFSELVEHDVITQDEYEYLFNAQTFIWRVRCGLHLISNRPEDRLLFDHQVKIANLMGFKDEQNNKAVENFMQLYYQKVILISRLNELILQYFEETSLTDEEKQPVTPLDDQFQIVHGYIDAIDDDLFQRRPVALLELFLTKMRNPMARGVRARTIRLVREARHLVNDDFRANTEAQRTFMQLLREPYGITHEFRRMNRYGILSRYIPAFRKIVGLMQFDLFHQFTVDEHTLMVLRNVRRLTVEEHKHELPLASEVMEHGIPKPELLYLGALFHDIAKGREGDHAELGAVDALEFCKGHGLSKSDADLVSWLVEQHLIMSMTAQRKDINDPDVISEFAEQMGSEERLNYMFLLTVSDIRGTNMELWNSWRESLMLQLYRATRKALRRGLHNPMLYSEQARENQHLAMRLLTDANKSNDAQRFWSTVTDEYFVRHSPEEIAWHAYTINKHNWQPGDTLAAMGTPVHEAGSIVFIYTKDTDFLFAHITAVLDMLNLDIVDARVYTTKDDHTVNSYVVLDENGEPVNDPERVTRIQDTLREALNNLSDAPVNVNRRTPMKLKAFETKTYVSFAPAPNDETQIAMELIAADRPGLLSIVGGQFREHGIVLRNAKITTVGERVEDVFFISVADENANINDTLGKLHQSLTDAIDAAFNA